MTNKFAAALFFVTRNFEYKIAKSCANEYEVHCVSDVYKWRLRANNIPRSEKLFVINIYVNEHAYSLVHEKMRITC